MYVMVIVCSGHQCQSPSRLDHPQVQMVLSDRPYLKPWTDQGERTSASGRTSPTARCATHDFYYKICDSRFTNGRLSDQDIEFKGPYCTLTMTDWFLQAQSVIPRGSWGDVARRFTMIRWETLSVERKKNTKSYSEKSNPLPSTLAVVAHRRRRNLYRPSWREDSVREIFVDFLVQTGEGVEILIVERIRRRSSRPTVEVPIPSWNWCIDRSRAQILKFFRCAARAGSGSAAAPTVQQVHWLKLSRLASKPQYVLASEKLLYTLEKSPPKEAPTNANPEELEKLEKWWDDELKARCYLIASMSNELQRRFEKT
ncbi:hypothetical protein F511_26701 [Dorcoceras hygrometricum]|uniref:Uncharacterized protein n=1 Tax=Dorcoceras hygrometricum TaxID=472368 RepID=A0A2Z7BKN7_9LAMI|nr:hypothetical protein F511_26701 [Dorcoceras hygrometricum]